MGGIMVALSEGRGIASFCGSVGHVWAKRGKIIAARGSDRFAGQRPARRVVEWVSAKKPPC